MATTHVDRELDSHQMFLVPRIFSAQPNKPNITTWALSSSQPPARVGIPLVSQVRPSGPRTTPVVVKRNGISMQSIKIPTIIHRHAQAKPLCFSGLIPYQAKK